LTDGVARTYTWLAKALNHLDVEFLFFSPCLPEHEEPWRSRVVQVPSFAFPLYRYYRVGWPNAAGLRRRLDAFKPDLIQVAAPTPLSILAQNYALKRGLPCVSSYHTHFVNYFPYYHLGFLQGAGWALLRWFHNRGQKTFVPSPSTLKALESKGFKNLEIWSRGLDTEKFSPSHKDGALRQRLAKRGETLALYVGRLVKDKDLDIFAKALRRLRSQGLKLRAAFAGDGPYRRALRRKLPKDHFLGFKHGAELSALYASADIFCFPSCNETFGNVVLEAMSSGLPVVAAASGGPMDLVNHGVNGLLSEPRNPKDFAEQIAALALNRPLRRRLALQGLATARGHHWLDVHRDLITHCRKLVRHSQRLRENPGLALAAPF
jgi:phosphatidylinositol alpha 1,6-mannosyltransferase